VCRSQKRPHQAIGTNIFEPANFVHA
jgi:hypothetical protein